MLQSKRRGISVCQRSTLSMVISLCLRAWLTRPRDENSMAVVSRIFKGTGESMEIIEPDRASAYGFDMKEKI